MVEIHPSVPLRLFTTLKAGGIAEQLCTVRNIGELADTVCHAHRSNVNLTVLGAGSNILPSDDGLDGLVVINRANRVLAARSGEVAADTGCAFQDLFLKTAQAGLHGFEFAVGIPGTLGGALVSNAGAYRSNVSEFITALDVIHDGERKTVAPEYLEFSYRDSILRRPQPPKLVVLRTEFLLPAGEAKAIYDEAREYQRQRISKQPPPASAGSFFKNVQHPELAETRPGLSDGMRKAGVVPAGFLIEAAGLKGFRLGGAMLGARHANFILNVGNATAFEIRRLADHAKTVVMEKFGIRLEEEVLYLGNWDRYFDAA